MKKVFLFGFVALMAGAVAANAGWRERLGIVPTPEAPKVEAPAPAVEEVATVAETVAVEEPVMAAEEVAGNEAEMALEQGTTVVQEMEEPVVGFVPNPEDAEVEEIME